MLNDDLTSSILRYLSDKEERTLDDILKQVKT